MKEETVESHRKNLEQRIIKLKQYKFFISQTSLVLKINYIGFLFQLLVFRHQVLR